MAVTDVGLSALTSESTDYINGYRVYAGASDKPLYLKWRTLSGAEANDSFDISVDYRYVPRGTSEDGYWTDWHGGGWTNIPVSECNGRQSGGQSGWQWSLDLATLLDRCGLKEGFTDGSTFGFGSRKFDIVHMQVNIKSQMSNGSASPRTDTQLWLGYFPAYEIERVYCDTLDEVKVEYFADGWERVDDRWSLESLDVDGASLLLNSKPWGTVARHSASGNGTVIIPVEKLAKAAPIGKNVYLKLNFNAAYRQSGAEFASAETILECENDAECNTPTLSIVAEGDRVLVTVGDAGDKDKAVKSCLVKLEGSEYRFDQQIINVGETAVFDYLPRGVPLEFSAVATAGEGTVSSEATATCPALRSTNALSLVSLLDPSLKACAKYDLTIDDDFKPERQTIKLAGRNRPSVFYGEGGEALWNLSFSILPESLEPDPSCRKDAWSKLSEAGDCVLFLADGTRKQVSVDSVMFSRSCTTGGVVTAYVTLSEVGA